MRHLDAQLRGTRTKLAAAVRASGTTLTQVSGVGPVIAGTITGDIADVSRFPGRDHFASYNGTAPAGVSSRNRKIHRLSLRGNRRVNHAIHMAAINWIRHKHSDGRAGDRADIDDVGDPARVLFGGLQQVREGGAGGVEQALHVDGDHAVPLPGVCSEDGAQEHQAGIVDHDVESPELPGSLLDGRLGLGAVGDVRFDGQRGAACVLDVGGEGLQAVAAAGHERDAGAALGEPAGGGGADTAARAGDERGGAGQFRCHGCCPSSLDVRHWGRRRGVLTWCTSGSVSGRPFGCSPSAPGSLPAGVAPRGR